MEFFAQHRSTHHLYGCQTVFLNSSIINSIKFQAVSQSYQLTQYLSFPAISIIDYKWQTPFTACTVLFPRRLFPPLVSISRTRHPLKASPVWSLGSSGVVQANCLNASCVEACRRLSAAGGTTHVGVPPDHWYRVNNTLALSIVNTHTHSRAHTFSYKRLCYFVNSGASATVRIGYRVK